MVKNQLTVDRAAEADRQDYRDLLAPQALPPEEMADAPDFQPILSTPEELRLPSPLVTVSVNQTVSLRDLLFELADQAGVDLELDPQIRGTIIFTAKERPFDQVVDRICEMAGLRYKFQNDILRIEMDRPYIKNYKVDYLPVSRTGDMSVTTDITLGGSGGEGAQTGGGSSSTAEMELDSDLWEDLETSLTDLLAATDTYTPLATLSANPVARVQSPLPPPPTPDPNNPQATPPPLPGSPAVAPIPPSATPVVNIGSLPPDPLSDTPPAGFTISQATGIVTVFASERQHKIVEKFFDEFRKYANTQVLIEARVLQVELSDEYSMGIDWGQLNLTGLLSISDPVGALSTTGGVVTRLQSGNDVNVAVNALSTFGTVRALSSPRVTVLNNQLAIVNVTQNNVFFEIETEAPTISDGVTTTPTATSTRINVPEGVILNVLPSANPETGEVILSVRPTVSRIASTIEDPVTPIQFALAGVPLPPNLPPNRVPQLSIQEIDSVLRIQSGQTIVMGGLMQDTNNVTETGVPMLSELPFIGNAFRSHSDNVQKSEIVIFITARILPAGYVDDMDRKVYKQFGLDRRPVRM